jgi:outer membrane protein assembly factor BamB
LTRRWNANVGLGYATPLLVGNRLYVFARQGEDEVMTSLDAANGTPVWRLAYPAPFMMNGSTRQHGPGPKSTPAFANGRLFSIGMAGTVTAYDAASGRQLWQVPGTGVQPIFTTHAFSPLVDGDRVIFHVGGNNDGALTAFDAATGAVRWRWAGDGPAYASPLLLTIDGTRQVVTLTQRKLVGIDAATGTLLWERPYTTPSVTNAQTPVVHGQMLILGDAGHPLEAFTIARRDGRWTADVAWQNADVPTRLSNTVLVEGVIYGLSTRNAGQYFAADAASGRTLWTSPPRQAGQAALVAAGSVVISLEQDGELVVIPMSQTTFEPVRRYKVADTPTWTPPVLSGNRIFVKDESTLTLWTVN